jgi:hypothetical protein
MTRDKADYRLKDYDISDFDENMNLKFGAINFLILIYLLTPIAISFVCSHAKGNAGIQILKSSFLTKELMYLSLLGTLPVIVFLLSYLVRAKWHRIEKIQENGRAFILTTAVLNFIIWSYILLHSGYKANLFHIISMVVSFFTLFYVIKSKRLRDYFLTRITPPEAKAT